MRGPLQRSFFRFFAEVTSVKRLTSQKRASASDRRLVAFHEAGHAIVASYFGVYPESIRIWPMQGGGWMGTNDFRPGALESLPEHARRVIAIAGAVATTIYLGIPVEYWPLHASNKDWLWICPIDGNQMLVALRETTAILQRERDFLLKLSRSLIVKSRNEKAAP